MNLLFGNNRSRLSLIQCLLLVVTSTLTFSALAQTFDSLPPPDDLNISTYLNTKKLITIAVIDDFSSVEVNPVRKSHLDELATLVANDFELAFVDYVFDWSSVDYTKQLNSIYQNPKVDMVLVMGVAANQIVVKRENFPKPTFLPFVVEREFIQAPFKKVKGSDNGISNKRNLSYLTYSDQFFDSLKALNEVVHFSDIAVIGDEVLFKALPNDLLSSATADGKLSISIVEHNGIDDDLLNKIRSSTDAVMIGYLPRMSNQKIHELIESLTEKGVPTFSYLEDGLVEQGLLATPLNDSVYLFTARRNALNMQAVMFGEPASQQPVLVETKAKLTINENTANRLGIAIDFQVLVDADVINFGVGQKKNQWGLIQIAELALQQNLDLKSTAFDLYLQQNEQSIAKSALLPQLSLNGSQLSRRSDSSAVKSGFFPEESTDVSLQLEQTLYSDQQQASLAIQKILSKAAKEQYRQAQLDTIREASLAMADVLQAQSVATIQQEGLAFSEKNLNLAEDRATIGASSAADQYRWETQVANAKSSVFESFSNVLISKQNLNRILNRNITDDLDISPIDMDASMVYTAKESFDLMDNTSTFEKVYLFGVSKTFDNAPEISRLEYAIQAKQRELKTIKRQRWLPDLSLNGQISDNLDTQSDLFTDNDGDGRDWQLTLNARIPFYQGGQIRAKKIRAELELGQLENQLASVKQRLSQDLRASMNNLVTSLFNLEFTRDASSAASRSLSLVTDSYSKGALQVVDLLDAQRASISADLAQVQAFIAYFRSNIEMQRTIGVFEFLMSEAQKQNIKQQIEMTINAKLGDSK